MLIAHLAVLSLATVRRESRTLVARKVECGAEDGAALARALEAVDFTVGGWRLGECLAAGAFAETWTVQGDAGKIAKVWKKNTKLYPAEIAAAAAAECGFAQKASSSRLQAHFAACFGSAPLALPGLPSAIAVYERVPGTDLETMAEQGALDPRLVQQVGQAMLQMQEPDEAGLVFFHPDLQLSNVMLRDGVVVFVDYDNCVACCLREPCESAPPCTDREVLGGLFYHAHYLFDDWMAASIARPATSSAFSSGFGWRGVLPADGPHNPRGLERLLENFEHSPVEQEGTTMPDELQDTPMGEVLMPGLKVPSAQELAALLAPYLRAPAPAATVAWLRASKALRLAGPGLREGSVRPEQLIRLMRSFLADTR